MLGAGGFRGFCYLTRALERGVRSRGEGILCAKTLPALVLKLDRTDNSLKLANSVTFDRMEKTLKHLRRVVVPSSPMAKSFETNTSATAQSLQPVSLQEDDENAHEDVAEVAQDPAGTTTSNSSQGQGDSDKAEDPAEAPKLPIPASASSQTSTARPVSHISFSHTQNTGLINSLMGIETPTWQDGLPPSFKDIETNDGTEPQVEWLGDRLNDSQKEAIKFCLKADSIACIHGPPGVSRFGKT